VLAAGQLLAERGSYFPDLSGYPYFVANYPPVFVGLVALGHRLAGPSLFFPRLLSLLAVLGLMVALHRAARATGDAPAPAAVLALLYAAPWFVTTWVALARVDTLAIFFSVAGLVVVLRHGVTRRAWPALLLFVLAVFTKQNAVLAPAAVLADLLLARDRRFPRALAAYALPLAALVALLVWATAGAAWRHLVPYTAAAEYEPGRMAECYLQLAVVAGPLLATIVASLLLVPQAYGPGAGRVLLLYLVLNLAAFATIAKAGAAQNYFLEPWAATLLLGGHAVRALCARFPALAAWRAALLLAAALAATYAYPAAHRLPHALRRPQNAEEFVRLTELVRTTPGDVLSENLSLLVVNRRPVLLEPFGVALIARQGLLDTGRLVDDCQRGRFPLVVVEHRTWEIPGFGACLERRYDLAEELGPYQVLRPHPTSGARR
jgi:hypothetical protein